MRRVNTLRIAKNTGRVFFWAGFASSIFGITCIILSFMYK